MATLQTAARILGCFNSDQRELTVTDAAGLLRIPKSKASRTMTAMLDAGLLERNTESRAYRPGVLLHISGRIYREAHGLFDLADSVVGRISKLTGHTGYVSRRDGDVVVGISDHPGTHVLRVMSSVGRPLAAFASATGRALLAVMPDDAIARLYPGPLNPPSPSAPQSLDELMARIATVRRLGYSESNDEANRGVGALATTVASADGEALALCIAFPAATVPAAEKRVIIEALLKGAAEINAMNNDDGVAGLLRVTGGAR